MKLIYKTEGTCSTEIALEIEADVVQRVEFSGGCRGNLQGLSRLVAGRRIEDLIALLSGIQCQNGTSCPDQLARALVGMLRERPPQPGACSPTRGE